MSFLMSFSNEQIGQFVAFVVAALFVPTAISQMGGIAKLKALLGLDQKAGDNKGKAPPSIRRDKSGGAAPVRTVKRSGGSGFGRR